MPSGTKPPRLSSDELVTIISDFYTFLATFYIPSLSLKHSPPGGLSNINEETTKGLKKAPCVIDLMKHLPYIDEADAHEMITNIHYKCDVVDYSRLTAEDFASELPYSGEGALRWRVEEQEEEEKNRNEEGEEDAKSQAVEEDDEDQDQEENDEEGDDNDTISTWSYDSQSDEIILTNMLCLATGYESGGRNLVLDVFNGIIHEDIVRCDSLSGVWVEDFFDNLRGKYERLEHVPVRGEFYEDVGDIEDEGGEDEDEGKQFKRIYQKFPWPGEEYRKDEAMAAVEAHRRSLDGE
jgi:hypothetical protein